MDHLQLCLHASDGLPSLNVASVRTKLRDDTYCPEGERVVTRVNVAPILLCSRFIADKD